MTEWYYDVNFWIALGTMIAASGTIITALWTRNSNKRQLIELQEQLKKQAEQTLTENYSVIMQQVDNSTAKHSRRILYRNRIRLEKLILTYSTRESILDDMNEIARYTAGIYDGLYFLLEDNKELRSKFIEHHGFLVGRLWVILKDLNKIWQTNDSQTSYSGFQKLGEECYKKYCTHVDTFIEKNYKSNIFPSEDSEINELAGRILGKRLSSL